MPIAVHGSSRDNTAKASGVSAGQRLHCRQSRSPVSVRRATSALMVASAAPTRWHTSSCYFFLSVALASMSGPTVGPSQFLPTPRSR
jgi:hypothetical protein